MDTNQHRRILTVLTATALTTALTTAFAALPAAARQDAGTATGHPAAPYRCAIQRVDTQLVGCDNLTGNGVPAPAWVDER